MAIVINSLPELRELFRLSPCKAEIAEESFGKTRYVSYQIFKELECYELWFEPYQEIARQCSMTQVLVFKSQITNRFYIGFVNLGGHGARWEIRPVKLEHVLDHDYLKKMYRNHAQELDWGIDLHENYEV
jgi:hypothetical protein